MKLTGKGQTESQAAFMEAIFPKIDRLLSINFKPLTVTNLLLFIASLNYCQKLKICGQTNFKVVLQGCLRFILASLFRLHVVCTSQVRATPLPPTPPLLINILISQIWNSLNQKQHKLCKQSGLDLVNSIGDRKYIVFYGKLYFESFQKFELTAKFWPDAAFISCVLSVSSMKLNNNGCFSHAIWTRKSVRLVTSCMWL